MKWIPHGGVVVDRNSELGDLMPEAPVALVTFSIYYALL